MKYEVIISQKNELEDLEREVNWYLERGWELVGGVAVCYEGGDTYYYQAICKKDCGC